MIGRIGPKRREKESSFEVFEKQCGWHTLKLKWKRLGQIRWMRELK